MKGLNKGITTKSHQGSFFWLFLCVPSCPLWLLPFADPLLPVHPLQDLPERRAAMAVLCLLLRVQLGKRLPNRGKIKHRIVTKSIRPTQSIQNHALCASTKRSQSLSISRRGDDANESPS